MKTKSTKDNLAAGIAKIIADWKKQSKILKQMQREQTNCSKKIIACEAAMGRIMKKAEKVNIHHRR